MSLRIVNYGTIMLEQLRRRRPGCHRDMIRKLPLDVQRSLQERTVKEIVAQAGGVEYLLVDTHAVVKTPTGYLPGLPVHVLRGLRPDLLVLIEALPRDIAQRRAADATRMRDVEPEDGIREELELSRAAAVTCSTVVGVPLKIVMNKSGGQDEAAMEILRALTGL